MEKIKDKDRLSKAARENQQVTYKGTMVRAITADFSAETPEGQKGFAQCIQNDERKT